MLRSAPRPALACLLLLCLLRTLLPEAWVLALHPHQHTTHEPAFSVCQRDGHLVFSSRHQHCHTEQFYEVPFTVAGAVSLPRPRVRPHYQQLALLLPAACPKQAGRYLHLRGPPLT